VLHDAQILMADHEVVAVQRSATDGPLMELEIGGAQAGGVNPNHRLEGLRIRVRDVGANVEGVRSSRLYGYGSHGGMIASPNPHALTGNREDRGPRAD
jgi:hypothetical protein